MEETNYIKKINKAINSTKHVEVAALMKTSDGYTIKTNKKGSYDSNRHEKHAEYLIAKEIEKNDFKNIDILISLIPCSHCLLELEKNIEKINKIEYILDFKNKKSKEYIKLFNQRNPNKLISIYDNIKNSKNKKYIEHIWFPLRKRLSGKRHRTSTKQLLKELGIKKEPKQKWINATKKLHPNGEYDNKKL